MKSLIAQLRNNFNASVAEVGSNDVYQRAEVGFALAGNDRKMINSKTDKIFNMAERLGLAEIIDTQMEIINFQTEDLRGLAEITDTQMEIINF